MYYFTHRYKICAICGTIIVYCGIMSDFDRRNFHKGIVCRLHSNRPSQSILHDLNINYGVLRAVVLCVPYARTRLYYFTMNTGSN